MRLNIEGGVPLSQISQDLGVCRSVCRSLLGKWKRQLTAQEESGTRTFPGHGRAADEELVRLRREVAVLRQEREVLKKAVSIFAPQLR